MLSFNLIEFCIYFSVRYCIEATWLNDRDQFLYPNDGWKNDLEFQSDCLTFTLFHGQNRVTSKDGTNHQPGAYNQRLIQSDYAWRIYKEIM